MTPGLVLGAFLSLTSYSYVKKRSYDQIHMKLTRDYFYLLTGTGFDRV